MSTIKISASTVKELTTCSLSFYYSRIQRVPPREWARTTIGSMAHSLLECLRNPRHRRHYDTITAPGDRVDYTLSPAVSRFVRCWRDKHNLSDELIADVNGMLTVALLLNDFFFTKAQRVYPPEHEFNLTLAGGAEVRGFIDGMAEQDGIMVIRDYKSGRNRFTAAELADNIQSILYQMYVWKTYRLPARVEFIWLRHPPTKRTPDKWRQVVKPATPAQLEGLEVYLDGIYRQINSFGLEEAMASPHRQVSWCQNVCGYLRPFDYWALVPAADPTITTPLRTYHLDKAPQKAQTEALGEGLILVRRSHPGCLARWSQPQ